MPSSFSVVQLAHDFLQKHLQEGDVCIDATAGRGNDTLFLCQQVGEKGMVYAFDIQAAAVQSTRERLEANGWNNAQVLQQGHETMSEVVPEGVAAVVFNFGWLPGGVHTVFTRKESSLSAIRQGLSLLKQGGVMSLSIYYGRENGMEEKDAILEFVQALDSRQYTVMVTQFWNRHNCSPIQVNILKDNP